MAALVGAAQAQLRPRPSLPPPRRDHEVGRHTNAAKDNACTLENPRQVEMRVWPIDACVAYTHVAIHSPPVRRLRDGPRPASIRVRRAWTRARPRQPVRG